MDDFEGNDMFMENHNGQRANDVVYNPQYEQYGNYVPTILPLRYDAFIYLNEIKALHPLYIEPDGAQMPETYPFGMWTIDFYIRIFWNRERKKYQRTEHPWK